MINIGNAILKMEFDNGVEEVKRDVSVLLSVAEGEQPLNRNFGINGDCLSRGTEDAKNLFVIEIMSKVEHYIKGVEVISVAFENDTDGNLTPTILLGRKT
jgi:hypothetical protein